MPRFALGASVSVSVALLLPGFGSVTPTGAVTVAVLTSEPVADAETLQLAVYVTLPPVGSMTMDEIEKAMILKSLKHHTGNISKVAEALGLSRAALYRRLPALDAAVGDCRRYVCLAGA